MPHYAPLPKFFEDVEIAQTVSGYEANVVHTAAPKRGFFFLQRVFCYLTPAAGVRLLGLAHIVQSVCVLLMAVLLVIARSNEATIDHAIETFVMSNSTAAETILPGFTLNSTPHGIQHLNHLINVCASRGIPVLLLLALVFFYSGAIAFKAGDGIEWAARRYYVLKIVNLCFTIFSLSACNVILAGYVTVVARSLWVLILEDKPAVSSAPPSYEEAVAKTFATDAPGATTNHFHIGDKA